VSTYAYLGPAATFTEAALKKITTPSDQLVPYANVTAALNAVRNNEAEFALVPIENSIEGVVARTLDELATGEPLIIAGEVTLPVSFAFMVKPGTKEIKRIATHPHAEAQCRTYVANKYPHAEVVATNSTAAAAEALSRGEFDAAIASAVAADRYGLEILAENIGDNTEAVTRFVLVSKPGHYLNPLGMTELQWRFSSAPTTQARY
jgi:prephenate dehydratase